MVDATTELLNLRAVAGDNQPTPFDLSSEEIDGLLEEAQHWLDGRAVKSQAEADGVSKILAALRSAEKIAVAAKKTEKAPFDAAAAAVIEKWSLPLERVELAQRVCKDALSPWLKQEAQKKKEAAESARRIADAKMLAAQEAIRATSIADLAQREQAETQLRDAKKADKFAIRAEKAKAGAHGGARAVTLRTTYRPVLIDAPKAAKHYWAERRPDMETFLLSLAETDVRAGKRSIPGFRIIEEKTAV